MGKRGGRPPAPPNGDTVEINEVALHLRDLLDSRGMTIANLHDRLRGEHFRSGSVPAPASVARILRGKALRHEPGLVDFIIELCAPPAELAATRKRIKRPFVIASSDRGTLVAVDPAEGLANEIAKLRREVFRLRNELTVGPVADTSRAQLELIMMWLLTQPSYAPPPQPVRPSRNVPAVIPALTVSPVSDAALLRLESTLRSLDPDGIRAAAVLRRCLDVLYDGARTGRYRWEHLSKEEKTFLGIRFRQELARELGLEDGDNLGFRLDGVEFALAFSTRPGGWAIHPDDLGQPHLLITGDERSGISAVFVRADPELLGPPNRDGKRLLTRATRAALSWLYYETPLPLNVLATLSDDLLDRIFAPMSSQKRIDELFRVVQGQPVGAAVLRTVAMNEDATKRVREARRRLRAEGLLILSGSFRAHRSVLERLGIGGTPPGQWVMSVRVVADVASDGPSVELAGRRWRQARPGDALEEAPQLPSARVG
jgi:hypothetical protein